MKKFFSLSPVLVFFIVFNSLCAKELPEDDSKYKEITTKTCVPLFGALGKGNVNTIRQFISGKMYDENKVLLEQNKEYPKFLREFYRGAKFSIDKVIELETDTDAKSSVDTIVYVGIVFKTGDTNQIRLRVKKDEGDLIWKVVDYVDDSEQK